MWTGKNLSLIGTARGCLLLLLAHVYLITAAYNPRGPPSTPTGQQSSSFELQCGCVSRVGRCLPNHNPCVCSADGSGYSCRGSAVCSAAEMNGACGANSPGHATGRGLRCSCDTVR